MKRNVLYLCCQAYPLEYARSTDKTFITAICGEDKLAIVEFWLVEKMRYCGLSDGAELGARLAIRKPYAAALTIKPIPG
jgi:hypothetical protein